MVRAYIGIGSNMGDRVWYCDQAVKRLARVCHVVEVAPWFLTEPQDVHGQDWYLNGALAADTELSARSLLEHLLTIEKTLGRVRKHRWGPRTLDLDLLLFGNKIIREDGLTIPHPFMHRRRFVLVPLAKIAPGLKHPVLLKTMAELLEALPEDGQAVTPWKGE